MDETRRRIITVDDEPAILESIKDYFDELDIHAFADPLAALEELRGRSCDILLVDYRMPGMSGLDLLMEAKKLDAYRYGVLLTAYADKGLLEQFINRDLIRQFIEKPLSLKRLEEAFSQAFEDCSRIDAERNEMEELRRKNEELLAGAGQPVRIVGTRTGLDATMRKVREFSATNENVLITGETGTGKDVIARTIHALSPRRSEVFVKINCGAIPESLIESELFGHVKGAFSGAYRDRVGKIEAADRGTLFLDEVSELRLDLQTRLLQVTQEKCIERVGGSKQIKVDFRLISASNRDLPAEVAKGAFREDLFYRLGTFSLHIPPLRERRADLADFAEYFLELFRRELDRGPIALAPDALEKLSAYHWPGNVRELENVLKRAVILSDKTASRLCAESFDFLPARDRKGPDALPAALATIGLAIKAGRLEFGYLEDSVLQTLLDDCGRNVMELVRLTGIPKDRFYRLLKKPHDASQ